MRRLDRWLMLITPLLVSAVLVVSILLLGVTQREMQRQTERAEARTERLVEMLEEGRQQWGPALEDIHAVVDRLCEMTEGCDR